MLLKTITVFLLASSGLWAQMILPYAQSFSEPCTAGVGGVVQYQSVRTVNDGTTPASGALPGCIVVPTLSTNTVGAGHGIAQTAATVGQLVMVVQLGQSQAWSDTNVTINDVMIPSSATNGLVSDSGASANGALTNYVGARGRAMTAATGCSSGSPCIFTLELYPNQTTGTLPAAKFYNASGLITTTSFKCWIGSATTTTGGVFTISYSIAGFTATPVVQMQAVSAGSAPNQLYTAYPTSVTSTTTSGFVASGTTLSLLGATLVLAPASVVTYIQACGI